MIQQTFVLIAMRLARFWIVPVFAVCTGCTAYTLSTLHSESDRLQTTKAACQGNSGATADPTLCLTSLDTPLLDLARKARDAAQQAADERTRISFLAISALSGWSSLTEEGVQLADDVATEGVERCAALDPKTSFVPPRDCNLLELEPGFGRHARAIMFLTTIDHTPQPLDPATLMALHEQSATYVANTWDFIEGKRHELDGRRVLNADIAAYLDKQKLPLYCAAQKLAVWEDKVDGPALAAIQADIDTKMTGPLHFKPELCTPSMFGLN